MSQITSGLRSVFSSASVYDWFQDLLGADQIRRELAREFIKATPGMRVLDVGCGTAGILAYLPQDIVYFGFDVSSIYIDAATKRFGNRGNFHCGYFDDAQAAPLKGSIDIVIGLGILHHLEDTEAKHVFNLARSVLRPGGRTLTMDPVYVDGQGSIAKYLIDNDRGQNVRTPPAYKALPAGLFDSIDGRIRRRSRIPYTEWVMECGLPEAEGT